MKFQFNNSYVSSKLHIKKARSNEGSKMFNILPVDPKEKKGDNFNQYFCYSGTYFVFLTFKNLVVMLKT